MGLKLPTALRDAPPLVAYEAMRGLWMAAVAQLVADAVCPDADLFAGRGTSTRANRPTAHERSLARSVLTLPEHAGWRREMCDFAGLSADALDRAGRILRAHGWLMSPDARAVMLDASGAGGLRGLAVPVPPQERRKRGGSTRRRPYRRRGG